MLDQPHTAALEEQRELVRRYADRLREFARGGRPRPSDQNGRRCYELLNELHLELTTRSRTRRDAPGGEMVNRS